jgi:hypothetical protein
MSEKGTKPWLVSLHATPLAGAVVQAQIVV